MGQEGRPQAPFQRGRVRGAEIRTFGFQGAVRPPRQWIDAERRAARQEVKLVPFAPHQGAAEQAAAQLFAIPGHGLVGDGAPGLEANPAGGDPRRRTVLVGGQDGSDEVGPGHPLQPSRIPGDLVPHQSLGQDTALLHPDHQERTALVVTFQEGQERSSHVAVGEGPRRTGVLAQRQHGVQAGLSVARGEQAAAAKEGTGVVGQHHLLELATGARVVDRSVPVLATVVGGGMDEEHVGRPVARRRLQRVARQQRPRRGPRVVRRRRRAVGLVRLPGVQRRPQDLVPEQECGHQDERQHDARANVQPSLEGSRGHSPRYRRRGLPGRVGMRLNHLRRRILSSGQEMAAGHSGARVTRFDPPPVVC